MKALTHPSTILALLALFVALGGGAAWASGLISGSQIKNHSIPTKKLTKSAITSLRGRRGPAGARGPQGAQGVQGAAGAAGATGAAGTRGPAGIGIDALFGDGSDGDVTISANSTLTRDMYYDNLTIASGVALNPGGYRIFVSGTLTLDNGATIERNATGILGFAAGTLGGSGSGGISADGQGQPNSLGGNGGNGGVLGIGGSASPPAAGAGGVGVFRQALAAISGRSLDDAIVNGGAGGGAGLTGLGGAGGGVVVVAAQTITVNGTARMEATGRGGFNDGGGGGGGAVVVISETAHPAGITLSAQGGAGTSGGANGAPGYTDWLN